MIALNGISPDEILIYLRKSRTDDPSFSIAETLKKHESMLDDWCMRSLGALVTEQNRFREIVSGETISARPEMQKVLHLIEQDKFKAILIVEPQRLSRGDLEDIGRLSKLLRYTHTIVITLQYAYDLSDDRDRDYFERELKRGNEYLEYTKRILHNGRQSSAESGAYIGSVAPFGYRRITTKIGKRIVPTLEIIPDEADAVRIVFQMYADGKGAATIIQALNAAGAKPKVAAEWSENVIYRMLDNPHYIGMIRYNFRRNVATVENGEIIKRRPHSKSAELYPALHEPIISRDLWERVRAQRLSRHIPAVHSSLILSNPLAGLVYCECGEIMIKSSPRGGRKPRLYCKHQATCGNVSAILADVVDGAAQALSAELASENIIAEPERRPDEIAPRIQLLEKRLISLQKKQDALWEQLAEGMPRDVFDRLIASVSSDMSAAKEALEAAHAELSRAGVAEEKAHSLQEALAAISGDECTPAQKNQFLKAIIRRITYSRKKGDDFCIHIELTI